MDDLIQKLETYGADVPGLLNRLCGDRGLLVQCLDIFLRDENFALLRTAIAAGQCTEAFECAHTLKGVAGNLGLTPIYMTICAMVEFLRSGDLSGAVELLPELDRRQAELETLFSV